MTFDEIIYEKADRVATVTLNRPDRMNAWTRRLDDQLRAAMAEAEGDAEIGAIIVTGAGRAFCAGADMGALSKIAQGTEAVDGGTRTGSRDAANGGPEANFRGRFSWLLAQRKPTIAAINGACVGMGFTNSLFYDIRIASDRARMGLIFVRRGLAIEHGSSWMLPRIVGVANAVDLAVTGRLVDAQEALRMGLVSRVVPHDQLMATARELARDIATQCSPLGVGHAKRMVYQHLFTDLATAARDEDEIIEVMTKSEDFKEGIKAFTEKRAPHFKGR
ncbi:MAG: enoyl-CoA hydratase-related protein [Candidatus Binataceae bacterium]